MIYCATCGRPLNEVHAADYWWCRFCDKRFSGKIVQAASAGVFKANPEVRAERMGRSLVNELRENNRGVSAEDYAALMSSVADIVISEMRLAQESCRPPDEFDLGFGEDQDTDR